MSVVYLLRDGEFYKVGYTLDFQKRLKQYRTHNLHVTVLEYFEGTRKDETALHHLCAKYQIQTEWFTSDIVSIWNKYWYDKNIEDSIEEDRYLDNIMEQYYGFKQSKRKR